VRGVIETIMEEELDATLSRRRHGRRKAAGSIDHAAPIVGSRHGHRTRTLTGTSGTTEIAVPRARIKGEDGKTSEWKSKSLRAYQRRTRQAEALITGAGTCPAASSFANRMTPQHQVFLQDVRKQVKSFWNDMLRSEPCVRLIAAAIDASSRRIDYYSSVRRSADGFHGAPS